MIGLVVGLGIGGLFTYFTHDWAVFHAAIIITAGIMAALGITTSGGKSVFSWVATVGLFVAYVLMLQGMYQFHMWHIWASLGILTLTVTIRTEGFQDWSDDGDDTMFWFFLDALVDALSSNEGGGWFDGGD